MLLLAICLVMAHPKLCHSGATACTSCGVGRYTPEYYGASTCTACQGGRYASATGTNANGCTTCPAGRFSSSGERTLLCSLPSPMSPDLAFAPTAATACTYCPGGQYQNSAASSFCYTCPSVRGCSLLPYFLATCFTNSHGHAAMRCSGILLPGRRYDLHSLPGWLLLPFVIERLQCLPRGEVFRCL